MIATFQPCRLQGRISAPPSKSMAHRYLIGAALSGHACTLTGVDFSEDILASMDCLTALGAKITVDGNTVCVDPAGFMTVDQPTLFCRESGSTLRFFIPLALCLGKPVTLRESAAAGAPSGRIRGFVPRAGLLLSQGRARRHSMRKGGERALPNPRGYQQSVHHGADLRAGSSRRCLHH